MRVTLLVSHPVRSSLKLVRSFSSPPKFVTAVTSHVPTGPYSSAHGAHVPSFHATSAAFSSVLFAKAKRKIVGDALGDTLGDAVVGAALGDVLGSVLGDVLGDVVGDVLGDALGEALGAALGDVVVPHGLLSRSSTPSCKH